MTRVNCVNPERLSRQHLLAEHREITRIPNSILSGKLRVEYLPGPYRLGTGHVRWFTARLGWLRNRYEQVHTECLRRGYNVSYRWPDELSCSGNYVVTRQDVELNMTRLLEREPGHYKGTLIHRVKNGESNEPISKL